MHFGKVYTEQQVQDGDAPEVKKMLRALPMLNDCNLCAVIPYNQRVTRHHLGRIKAWIKALYKQIKHC